MLKLKKLNRKKPGRLPAIAASVLACEFPEAILHSYFVFGLAGIIIESLEDCQADSELRPLSRSHAEHPFVVPVPKWVNDVHFFDLAPAGVRAFCNCLMNPLAILLAAVPNNEFTFPLATTSRVLGFTTT